MSEQSMGGGVGGDDGDGGGDAGGGEGGSGEGGGGDGDGDEGEGENGEGGGVEGGGKYSRAPQSLQSVPRSHTAPSAVSCPSWQWLLSTSCAPSMPKGLVHVFSQSIGGDDGGAGGGGAGGE